MSGLHSILTEWVAPSLGVVTATAIFLSPLPEVRHIERTGEIGEYNPLPLAFIVTNTISWILFALLIQNYFIFWSNVLGFSLGLYYVVTVVSTGGVVGARKSLVIAVFAGGPFLILVGFHVAFLAINPTDPEKARSLGGTVCVIALVFFYTSPLSTLVHVVRSRDASSFSLALSLACVANGALWTVYGLAIGDAFVWGPNVLGTVVGVVQVALIWLFRDASKSPSAVVGAGARGGYQTVGESADDEWAG